MRSSEALSICTHQFGEGARTRRGLNRGLRAGPRQRLELELLRSDDPIRHGAEACPARYAVRGVWAASSLWFRRKGLQDAQPGWVAPLQMTGGVSDSADCKDEHRSKGPQPAN